MIISQLSPSQYGYFIIGLTILQIIPQIFDLGLSETIVRFGSEGSRNKNFLKFVIFHVLKVRIITIIGLILASFLLVPTISYFIKITNINIAITLELGIIGGAGTLLWNLILSYYQLREKFSTYGLLVIINSIILGAIVVTFLTIKPLDYRWILFAYVVTPWMAIILFGYPLYHLLVSIKDDKYDRSLLKNKIRHFSIWLTSSTISWILCRRIEVFIISFFLPIQLVGVYGAAVQLYSPLQMLARSVSVVILPKIFKIRDVSIKKYLSYSFLFSIIAIGGIGILLALSAKFIVSFLSSEYIDSVGVFQILIFVPAAGSLANLTSYIFLRENKPEIPSVINIIQAIFVTSALLIVVPNYGIVGAAWCVLLTSILGAVVQFLYAKKFLVN